MIKKTITPLILTALVGSASASVIALETGTNVALGATGITYTTSGFDEDNGNGDLGVNPGDGMTLTITFSQAVDIEISATSSRFGNVFDGSPGVASGTFITDGSAWNFAAGSNAGNANFSMLSTTTNTNDTFGISQDNGASLSSSEFDWGTLTSTGVKW